MNHPPAIKQPPTEQSTPVLGDFHETRMSVWMHAEG
jgi:hypothetical protein